MSKKKGWYYLPKHKLLIAKNYIKGYYEWLDEVVKYEESHNGYSSENSKFLLLQKSDEDIAEYIDNVRLIQTIESSQLKWTDIHYSKELWDYVVNGIENLDDFTIMILREEARKWYYGFAKDYGLIR